MHRSKKFFLDEPCRPSGKRHGLYETTQKHSFFFRLDWPLFMPAAVLNPEPLSPEPRTIIHTLSGPAPGSEFPSHLFQSRSGTRIPSDREKAWVCPNPISVCSFFNSFQKVKKDLRSGLRGKSLRIYLGSFSWIAPLTVFTF